MTTAAGESPPSLPSINPKEQPMTDTERKMKVEILRDYTPASPDSLPALDDHIRAGRIYAGEIASLPREEANKIIRAGIATVPKDD
jgi:hypothetical protein